MVYDKDRSGHMEMEELHHFIKVSGRNSHWFLFPADQYTRIAAFWPSSIICDVKELALSNNLICRNHNTS